MGSICFHNATVVTGYSLMENSCVYVKDGKIEDVFSERRFANKRFSPDVRIIDVGQAYVAPGLIDTHIHGFADSVQRINPLKLYWKCLKSLPIMA